MSFKNNKVKIPIKKRKFFCKVDTAYIFKTQ